VENIGHKAFLLFSGQGAFKTPERKLDAIDTTIALTQDDRARITLAFAKPNPPFLPASSLNSFLPFVAVFSFSVFEPCPYLSCLCLPSGTSFPICFATGFTITSHK
jgi:hypothetical protein